MKVGIMATWSLVRQRGVSKSAKMVDICGIHLQRVSVAADVSATSQWGHLVTVMRKRSGHHIYRPAARALPPHVAPTDVSNRIKPVFRSLRQEVSTL